MRKGILGSLAALTAGAGFSLGQPMGPPPGPGSYPPGLPPMSQPGPAVGPGGPGVPRYATPDGHPFIVPQGMENQIPPGSMGAGAPGGVYGSGDGMLNDFYGPQGPPRFWSSFEGLYWVPKSQTLNYPLITTSAPADFGLPGGATTTPVFGSFGDISYDSRAGGRVTLGMSFGSDSELGGELSGFWLENFEKSFSASSNAIGLPVLAVPFVDGTTGTGASYVISFPGISRGLVRMSGDTEVIGGEANAVLNMYAGGEAPGGLSLLAGVRYLSLQESFGFSTDSRTNGAFVPTPGSAGAFFPATSGPGGGNLFAGNEFPAGGAPFRVTTNDRIRTYNDFFAGQVGFRGDIGYGGFVVGLTGKIAAGYMRSRIDVEGVSTITTGGATSTQMGGLFNNPNDVSRNRVDRFAYMPEGGLTVGYQVFSFLKLSVGYNFLYINNVLRPTTNLTNYLNPSLTPASPAFTGSSPGIFQRDLKQGSDFHLHGYTAALQFSF